MDVHRSERVSPERAISRVEAIVCRFAAYRVGRYKVTRVCFRAERNGCKSMFTVLYYCGFAERRRGTGIYFLI